MKDSSMSYECTISVPSLKIHTEEKVFKEILENLPKMDYTNVIFSIEGNSVEVPIYSRNNAQIFANAKEISKLDLETFAILKQNTLVQKYLNMPVTPKKISRKM